MSGDRPELISVLRANQPRYVDELLELLCIPSVSAVERHAPDVLRAAEWVAARMKRAGVENIEPLPTGAHACVYGDWLHARHQRQTPQSRLGRGLSTQGTGWPGARELRCSRPANRLVL
jgi:acetylornithine deacetylase/succinyl-diaminopimelate desuccinylase-like protein